MTVTVRVQGIYNGPLCDLIRGLIPSPCCDSHEWHVLCRLTRIGFGVREAVQKLVDAEASFENGMAVPGAHNTIYTMSI